MNKYDDGSAPDWLLFPEDSITDVENPWKMLALTGRLPEFPKGKYPLSYMTGEPWIKLLSASVEDAPDYNSLMQLGVAALEFQRTDVLLKDAYDEDEDRAAISRAKELFLRSTELSPNAVAYFSLAKIATIEGDDEKAEEYYELAMKTPEYLLDYAVASEYLLLLKTHEKYEKLWDAFCNLPEAFKQVDRIKITAAFAAVKVGGDDKLDYLQKFFLEEHYDIREGEVSLTKVWFELCARKMAREDGYIELDADRLSSYIEKAEELCPPAYGIDFRMSLGKSKYR
jgi:tetratricopeptide (TPR) repeat protein